jgi:hypothetical protein
MMIEKCIYCGTNVNLDNLRYHDIYECPESKFIEKEKEILEMMGEDYGRNDRYYDTVLEKLAKENNARMHEFINNYIATFESKFTDQYIDKLFSDKICKIENKLDELQHIINNIIKVLKSDR